MGGQISLIRSIGWSCQALATICFIPTVLLNLHLQPVTNPYLLGARRQWLRVNCVERIGIWPVLRTWNWQWLKNLPSTRVYWSHISVSNKANGLPPWFIHNTSWTLWWVVECRTSKKYTAYMASSNKKKKINGICLNQTQRMRQQTSPDSLLLDLWRRSAYPNSCLSSWKNNLYKG